MSVLAETYRTKDALYFTGVRRDYIQEFPNGDILEIGCGDGANGAIALMNGKCRSYRGVEIFPEAAAKAARCIDEVIVGDIETVELPWSHESFDALVLSEVLEHLSDPWKVLRKVHPLLRRGAMIFASSPNVCHYKIIFGLVKGRWKFADFGPLDRTHLRWFSPLTYREMFEECGYSVIRCGKLADHGPKARIVSAFTFGKLDHLLSRQIDLRAIKSDADASARASCA